MLFNGAAGFLRLLLLALMLVALLAGYESLCFLRLSFVRIKLLEKRVSVFLGKSEDCRARCAAIFS